MKLTPEDYIMIGCVIALKEIAKKPITGGFIARPLMEKKLMEMDKETREFVMKTLNIPELNTICGETFQSKHGQTCICEKLIGHQSGHAGRLKIV